MLVLTSQRDVWIEIVHAGEVMRVKLRVAPNDDGRAGFKHSFIFDAPESFSIGRQNARTGPRSAGGGRAPVESRPQPIIKSK